MTIQSQGNVEWQRYDLPCLISKYWWQKKNKRKVSYQDKQNSGEEKKKDRFLRKDDFIKLIKNITEQSTPTLYSDNKLP